MNKLNSVAFIRSFHNYRSMTFITMLLVLFLFCRNGTLSAQKLIFQSGFEPDSKVANQAAIKCDIIGRDKSLPALSDWVNSLENQNDIGVFEIEYYGGDTTQRMAEIIPEPGNPSNHVLHYRVNYPNNIYASAGETEQRNGRIQATLYGEKGQKGPKEIFYSVRVLIPDEMSFLKSYPDPINFFTIAEFWNQEPYTPYTHMMTLEINKRIKGNGEFTFSFVVSEKIDPLGKEPRKEVWAADISPDIKVPFGKWFTLECYLKEGNASTGRVYMAITPEGGSKKVLFDVTNWTCHTKEPSPNGFGYLSLMKLYTSTELVNYAREKGSVLQMYWDDLKIWRNKTPDTR